MILGFSRYLSIIHALLNEQESTSMRNGNAKR